MPPKFARLALIAASLCAAPPVRASDDDLPADRGKRRVAVLFAPTIANAGPLVARVRAGKGDDARNVALATVVRSDGYLLTKASELSGPLRVVLQGGQEYPAVRVATHEPSDLALLKIEATGLRAAEFAPDKAAEVGNWVAAPGPTGGSTPVGVISVGPRKLYEDQAKVENGNRGVLGIFFEEGGKSTVVAKTKAGAKVAGIVGGDVVRALNGRPVTDLDEVMSVLNNYRPNERNRGHRRARRRHHDRRGGAERPRRPRHAAEHDGRLAERPPHRLPAGHPARHDRVAARLRRPADRPGGARAGHQHRPRRPRRDLGAAGERGACRAERDAGRQGGGGAVGGPRA